MLRAPNPMGYYSDSRGVNVRSGFSAEFADYREQQSELAVEAALVRLQQMEESYRFRGTSRVPTILILLQVQDDSNIIMGSPFFSMAEYVQHVVGVVEGSDYKVVVKPHPLDEVPALPEHVLVADKEESIADLIASADVVFTINSSAGFEAALAGKTVYALGKAPYSGTGLTIDVAQPADLAALWQEHRAVAPCSRALRAQILDFAQSRYFLGAAQFNEPSAHLSRLARTIPVDPARNTFDTDLESYRQQSYITWLEEKNQEMGGELSNLNETYLAARSELTSVRDELLFDEGSTLGHGQKVHFGAGRQISSRQRRIAADTEPTEPANRCPQIRNTGFEGGSAQRLCLEILVHDPSVQGCAAFAVAGLVETARRACQSPRCFTPDLSETSISDRHPHTLEPLCKSCAHQGDAGHQLAT